MGCDELLRDFQPENKTRARCGDVEAGSVCGSDLLLNEAGCGREKHVGRGCRHKDEIDFFRRNLRLLNCIQRCFRRHVARIFVLCSDAAFLDAGASGDPLVAGVYHAREIRVSQNLLRHVTSRADD